MIVLKENKSEAKFPITINCTHREFMTLKVAIIEMRSMSSGEVYKEFTEMLKSMIGEV